MTTDRPRGRARGSGPDGCGSSDPLACGLPGLGHRVVEITGIGIGHQWLGGGRTQHGQRPADDVGGHTVDADSDDRLLPLGPAGRLVEWVSAGQMSAVGPHLEGDPALGLRSEVLHHGDECLRLVQTRDGLQGEQIDSLPRQHLDTRPVDLPEAGVLRDTDVVSTGVLTAVGQVGAIGSQPSGNENLRLRMLRLEATGGLIGKADPGRDDLPSGSRVMPGPQQRRERRLIGVGRDDTGSGIQVVGMDRTHGLGCRGKCERRPQRVTGVDTTRVQLGAHRPVQNDRTTCQQIGKPGRFTPEGRGGCRERSHCDTVSDGSRRHR